MTGNHHINGQPDTNNDNSDDWKNTAQNSSKMLNDLVLSPFITGVLQGFFNVAMQRRRERRQARQAAATASAMAAENAANEAASVNQSAQVNTDVGSDGVNASPEPGTTDAS